MLPTGGMTGKSLVKVDGCAVCDDLWEEYARVTKECLKILGNQEIAALQHDHPGFEKLDAQYQDCDRRRDALRLAITAHSQEAHPPHLTQKP